MLFFNVNQHEFIVFNWFVNDNQHETEFSVKVNIITFNFICLFFLNFKFCRFINSLSLKLWVKIAYSNSFFVLMINLSSCIITRFQNVMKELRKLNFSLKILMLLLFNLCKMKFDGVSTNDYAVSFWMFAHIVIFISYTLKYFVQVRYKIFLTKIKLT